MNAPSLLPRLHIIDGNVVSCGPWIRQNDSVSFKIMQDSGKPSALACVPCRRRHLKCDARMPICTRCQNNHHDCRYVRSRRGLRSNKAGNQPTAEEEADALFSSNIMNWLDASFLDSDSLLDIPDLSLDIFHQQDPAPPSPTPAHVPHGEDITHDAMIQLYYHHFHRSHPVLLPRRALASSVAQHVPDFIPHIMRYIGSHYTATPTLKDGYYQPAYTALTATKDGFHVQGLLLLSILEHSHGREEAARRLLREAIQVAYSIGMHTQGFARENSRGYPVLEESWRRTWWELYVTEGLMAAMGSGQCEVLSSGWEDSDVWLASPEATCNEAGGSSSDTNPEPLTLSSLSDWPSGRTSSASRIHAVQYLRAVLELNQSLEPPTETQTETLDARLVSLLMRLSLTSSINDASTIDEMDFQALMITYLSLIHLHHPHSTIRFASYQCPATSNSTTATSSCTKLRVLSPPTSSSSKTTTTTTTAAAATPTTAPQHHSLNIHAQKMLRAADLISNLATLPSSVQSRTPFYTCALALAIVVHTATFTMLASSPSPSSPPALSSPTKGGVVGGSSAKDDALKARIELGVGALQVLGRVWPLAKQVRGEMVELYRGR
ncbi:Zn(II)2Cys6 transcription factor [Aspergillus saccharolyticus JOP 1030-1]|uniref:Zn(2)-C6 fungal-type domain-containing protein n=1 Tax=Aspergillus saccharolyticus JOP 1030-1 TaxID=1450539 RepID=A0A318Z876_9EURO|nr:hypothetical protein BP01DRAFT_358607 [Aspergillus saccharolyticus JOP 1030-1]PYH43349.1 hypothetical protein BP01DRAFT_358607 [Aspergillus saccharolyticus JOP 1030-1]